MDLNQATESIYRRLEEMPHDQYLAVAYVLASDVRDLYENLLPGDVVRLMDSSLELAANSDRDLAEAGELLDRWSLELDDESRITKPGIDYAYHVFESLVGEVRDLTLPPEEQNQYGPVREWVTQALTEDPVTPGPSGLVRIDVLPEAPPESLAEQLMLRAAKIIDVVQQENISLRPGIDRSRQALFGSLSPIPIP